jgi:ATP-dependent helicase HrpB
MLMLVEKSVLSMPVSEVLDEVIVALQQHPQVLLNAPAGAGKSTWLPLQLLQHLSLPGKIILLEPRRLAAKNVAWRLAQQLGEQPGQTIGYRMRAESKVSPSTRLEVVTEGILTRMLHSDGELSGVSLVILDEFHERSLQADLALALLLDVQQGLRDDLRLLIMSATLDNSRLSALLTEAPVITSLGRSYPVERHYLALSNQLRFSEAVASVCRRILTEHTGSMLVFLPGVAEITQVQALLVEQCASDIVINPLYGALSLSEQQQAICPAAPGQRKVVLATNIAETSLTIEGITLVVDSALERDTQYDVRSGLTRLLTQRISQASMTQRAGRAGRIAPGKCWHLLSKEQAERAMPQGSAEILHSDLTSLWLDVLQWGCRDIGQLTWLDKPAQAPLSAAQQLLAKLGAVDKQGSLTAKGRQMAALGCEPRLAAMLVNAEKQGADALATAALLVAIIEEPPRSGQTDIDYWLSRPQGHWQRRARQLAQRFSCALGAIDHAWVPWLLVPVFSDRLGLYRGQGERYLLANGLGAFLSADAGLNGRACLVAVQLLQSSQTPDARILLAAAVDERELAQRIPQLIQTRTHIEWDEEKGTLRAWQRWQIGQLTLKSQPLARPDDEQIQSALLSWIRTQGISALNWSESAQQWRIRLHCAAKWLPEYQWPAVDDESLLAQLERWLLPSLSGVRTLRALQQVDMSEALLRLLDWQQRRDLESALPSHFQVPTGSRLPIRYHSDQLPVLAVRLQEMFGQQVTPTLAQGRIALVLELLSPALRPLQITADLAAFWQGAYLEVQKEMKGRYPKHPWPDDPAKALPTRRTKKYQAGEK